MQVRGIYSVLKGKVEKAELNIEERQQGLFFKEGKHGQNDAEGRFMGGRESWKRERLPRLCCLTRGSDRRDWHWWQKADLPAVTGAGRGLAARGFNSSTGRPVSLC